MVSMNALFGPAHQGGSGQSSRLQGLAVVVAWGVGCTFLAVPIINSNCKIASCPAGASEGCERYRRMWS